MKFSIKLGSLPINKELIYIAEDYSFEMWPHDASVNFSLMINTINLSVGTDNSVMEVDGYCPRDGWIKGDYQVPSYHAGTLTVLDELESGFSYRINRDESLFNESPIYEDVQTGWVCAGDPQSNGQTVEFIKSCVAVIDDTGSLKALWLHPKYE